MDSNTFLDGLLRDAVASKDVVARYRRELGDVALTWKPVADVWSIAEIVQHLATTTDAYRTGLEATLARARLRPPTARRPFKARPFAAWFIRMAGPTSERRVKAPKRFLPQVSDTGPQVLDGFVNQQDELVQFIRRAGDVDLNRPRFGSPVTPLLRFSLGEALLLTVRHQERHLQQAERLRAHASFPA